MKAGYAASVAPIVSIASIAIKILGSPLLISIAPIVPIASIASIDLIALKEEAERAEPAQVQPSLLFLLCL